MSDERTSAQVLVGVGFASDLPKNAQALANSSDSRWVKKVRLMRRHGTLAFLRDMFSAPILSSEWTVVANKPEFRDAVDMVRESFIPFKDKFLEDAIRGLFDFGWQPYELVRAQHSDGSFYITKIKALLQDFSTIIVDNCGELAGVQNRPIFGSLMSDITPVNLFRGECVVLYTNAEGTNWYGEARMRRCERAFDSWMESDDAARRFDNKIAGAHWVVYYPPGQSPYNGAMTDNYVIAGDILKALYSSGQVAIPSSANRVIEDLNAASSSPQWKIELLTANTQQATFVDRGRYLDSIMSRGVGIPERATLEGQFGTKAEAEAHADFAIDNIETFHRAILALLNRQAVDPLLELNRGVDYRGKVRLEASPLSDTRRAFLRQLYTSHIGTESGQAEETERIDYDSIREQLGVPVRLSSDSSSTSRYARYTSRKIQDDAGAE